MTLDLLFWGLVMIFALIGFFSGFWMQLMRLGALVLAYLLAGLVGRPLGAPLGRALGIPSLLGTVLGAGLAFLLLYTIFSTVGWTLLRRHERKKMKEGEPGGKATWERFAGAGLGGAKVFLVLYLVLCMVVLVEKPLSDALGRGSRLFGTSFMAGFARDHNLLASLHLPVIGNAATLGKIATDPGFHARAMENPKVRRLLDHPKMKELLTDRALVSAAKRNDVAAVLANPRLNQVLSDPEIQKLLGEIDLGSI